MDGSIKLRHDLLRIEILNYKLPLLRAARSVGLWVYTAGFSDSELSGVGAATLDSTGAMAPPRER